MNPDDNLAALDAGFAELLTKHRALTERADSLARQRHELLAKGSARGPAIPAPPAPRPPDAAALALLGDLAETVAPPPPASAPTMPAGLAEVQAAERATSQALALLAGPLRTARIRASLAAWEAEKPGFAKAVAGYCGAVLALDRATRELSDAQDRLQAAGAPSPFPIPHPAALRLPMGALQMVEEAMQAGLFPAKARAAA